MKRQRNQNYLLTFKKEKMSAFSDKVSGNWKEIKGKMKQEYATLTDNDLMYEKGKEDEILGRLQTKLGKTKQEVTDWINSIGN